MTNIEAMKLALEALETADEVGFWELQKTAITALRTAIEAAEKQEPVATVRTWHKNSDQHAELGDWELGLFKLPDGEHTLYAASPAAQRQPLTDEQMKLLWAEYGYRSAMCKPFARAIEAAHGIKEKNR